MHDGVDRLREIDDDRALAPPQDVEGREIPVHKLGFEDQANLALQLSPDPSCGPQVEIDIALLAGLEHAEIAIFVGCVGKPVAWEQCGHASSVLEKRRWMRPSRAALESARRSRDAEAGGVTRDSNAHLTASFRLSTRGRARRVALTVSRLASKVSTGTPAPRGPDQRSATVACRSGTS